jgi:serine/threonine protein kinase
VNLEKQLVTLLTSTGLVSEAEMDLAQEEAARSGDTLAEVLVARGAVSARQIEDARATLEGKGRYCAACGEAVLVPRATPEGERCPRCLGPLEWRQKSPVTGEVDAQAVALADGELPPEVLVARADLRNLMGKYILLAELGKGASAVVRKAWDTMLGSFVALKFMRGLRDEPARKEGSPLNWASQVQDFLKEARTSLRLRHPNIIAIHDIGRVGDQLYIAMDYVEGRTLARHIDAARERGQISALYEDPVQYIRFMKDIAAALHYAHTRPRPVVHCDLKPSNIMIGMDGVACVMDFGIAHVLGARLQRDEPVRGTPSYMAPEQLSGTPADIGPWTDVYGLGATLYELLTGRPVFSGETPQVLHRTLFQTPQSPSEVVREIERGRSGGSSRLLKRVTKLEALCMRCLSKEPPVRCASAAEVADELQDVIDALQASDPRERQGVVPEDLQDAHVRSNVRKVDRNITEMRLDEALEEVKKLQQAEGQSGTSTKIRIADRRHEVEILYGFRDRLIRRLNEARPVLSELRLTTGTIAAVEILKATPQKLVVYGDGRSLDVPWLALLADQFILLVQKIGLEAPEDRLALMIYCRHANLKEIEAKYRASLAGTPLQDAAQQIAEAAAS